MKFEVPQELIDQIIDLYKKTSNRKKVREILNLPFGDSVVKRILLENNIPIVSNPGALASAKKPQKMFVPEELQQQIIDLYVNKGYGMIKIVHELKLPFSADKVKSILKDNNIHIRNNVEAYKVSKKPELRKYKVNDDYILESHNGAWLLGFVAADGYLPITKGAKNRITISLSLVDKEILETIKKELEYEGPIYEYESSEYNGKTFPFVSLSFTSQKLRQQFENYGIVNNKTFKLEHLPKLPEEYLLDFIRGFFDGDGTIGIHHKDSGIIQMGITCANKNFLDEINQFLHQKLPLQYKGGISRDHNNWCLSFGDKDSNIIGSAFYDNNFLALPRKKEKFNQLRK